MAGTSRVRRLIMLNAYQTAFDALPAALRSPARREAMEAFIRLGLPNTELEDWKYTDLAPLTKLGPEALAVSRDGTFAPAPRNVFDDGLDALNYAFCSGGLDRTITADERAPIILAGPGHQRHRLTLAPNAAATVIFDSAQAGTLQTVFAELSAGANSQLTLLRFGNPADDAHQITRIKIKLERDARLHAVSLDVSGKLCRHELLVTLDAPGAEARVSGLYLLDGDSFVDNHTRIDHRAPRGTSRELFRGIVRDRARAVFNGKVIVHPHAVKTDSEQHIANLLLSPQAQVNAKPELQIDNDDVKCAHGATSGQLDEAAIYYLRSRGLPLDAARNALLCAFAHEVLQRIPLEDQRQRAERLVAARLRGGMLTT